MPRQRGRSAMAAPQGGLEWQGDRPVIEALPSSKCGPQSKRAKPDGISAWPARDASCSLTESSSCLCPLLWQPQQTTPCR